MQIISSIIKAVTLIIIPSYALAFEGLVATELPIGGDVTIPGQFPVLVQTSTEVVLTGHDLPQSIVLTNSDKKASSINLYAQKEKNTRKITLQPGSSKIYNLDKTTKSIRIRVTQGNIRVNSLQPLKVQR